MSKMYTMMILGMIVVRSIVNIKEHGFKKLFHFLLFSVLFLNLFDVIATDIGLRYQFIEEENPLMAMIHNVAPSLFWFIKISLSIAFYFIVPLLFIRKPAFTVTLLIPVTGIYLYAAYLHIYWIVLISPLKWL
jgi:hypothetical protein